MLTYRSDTSMIERVANTWCYRSVVRRADETHMYIHCLFYNDACRTRKACMCTRFRDACVRERATVGR